MIPGEPLPDDLADGHIKPVEVVQRCACVVFPVIVAINLLVDISEQMERFYADVRALQAALGDTVRL